MVMPLRWAPADGSSDSGKRLASIEKQASIAADVAFVHGMFADPTAVMARRPGVTRRMAPIEMLCKLCWMVNDQLSPLRRAKAQASEALLPEKAYVECCISPLVHQYLAL